MSFNCKVSELGYTDLAIAHELGISAATVGTYWARIRSKLGPHGRTELVSMMLQQQSATAIHILREENRQLLDHLKKRTMTGHIDLEVARRHFLDSLPDALIMVGKDGRIVRANAAAVELFGYSLEEFVDMPVTQLIPERFRSAHEHHRATYFEAPKRRSMGEHLDTPALHRNGTEFAIQASLYSRNPGRDGRRLPLAPEASEHPTVNANR